MVKGRPKHANGRHAATNAETGVTLQRKVSWKPRSSSVLWLKLNFTIKAARLQTLKRQKYQHLQEEALLKARGLLKNWEDGPVLLTEDLYSRAHTENDAKELVNYTPEALALRFSLRNNPDVLDAVKQLWSVELPRDEFGCIDQRGYAALFRRIGRSLEPDANAKRRRRMEKTIQEDWIRDSKGEATMSFANFFDSVFELADLWCETIDVEEYVIFLRSLVARVTSVRRRDEGRRLLRPLKQIKAIDDEDISSSSSEEVSESDLDEEESELIGDDDLADDDEEEDIPFQATPTPSLGLVATKALQVFRSKTPPPKASPSHEVQFSSNPLNPQPDEYSRLRERRASIISFGDFGLSGLGGFGTNRSNENEESPKTPKALRGSSAKSRLASAKGRKPMTSLQEIGDGATNAKDDEGVTALIAMHRLNSAQTRTPVVVEDIAPKNATSTTKLALDVNLSANQRQQRPGKLFMPSFGGPQLGFGTGNLNLDGLPSPAARLPRSALTSSAPHLIPNQEGLKSSVFGDIDSARVGSGGARRLMLSSNTPKARLNSDKKFAGVIFDGANEGGGSSRKISTLGVASSGSSSTSSFGRGSTENHQALAMGTIAAEYGIKNDQSPQTGLLNSQVADAPREYISGVGLDSLTPEMNEFGAFRSRHKPEILPMSVSLPFYTFDESVSPAKRLLPPVLTGNAGRGRSAASGKNSHRQGSAGLTNELDFTASYKKTAYLTGSLHSQILDRVSASRNGLNDGRPTSRDSHSLWFQRPGKDDKFYNQRGASKLPPNRARHLSPDDSYNDSTVSPWDTEFDDEHDDDLEKALPRHDKHRETYQRVTPGYTASTALVPSSPVNSASTPELPTDHFNVTKQPLEKLDIEDSGDDPPVLSISSPAVPPEPPSCCSDITTLPQEYHELVLGGSSISRQEILSRTESAPVPIPAQTPVVYQRVPQWKISDDSQPSPMLLEGGIEGHTIAGSPRQILTPLASKRVRRDRDAQDNEHCILCPRFLEHLESHGGHSATTLSPLIRTEKSRDARCTCTNAHKSYDSDEAFDDNKEGICHCHYHHHINNNFQEEQSEDGDQDVRVNLDEQIDDVTMILNTTRGLVLRPGTEDHYAAKRARKKQQATRSEMMRRRCQYTFGKY